MKGLGILQGCLICAALILSGCTSKDQKTTVEIGTERHLPLGIVTAPAKLPFQFTIKNKGTQAATIRAVESACSCTVVEAKGKTIKAGASLLLNGAIEVAAGSAGAYGRQVRLQAEPAGTASTTVTMHYWVPPKRRVATKPTEFELGTVQAGQGAMEKTLTITGEKRWMEVLSEKDIQLPAGASLVELSSAKAHPHLEEIQTRTARLRFDFGQMAGVGSQQGMVVLFPGAEDGLAVRFYWNALLGATSSAPK